MRDRLHPDKRVLVEPDRAQFAALPYAALDRTDHVTRQELASTIRRYIIWRNNHAYHERLRCIIDRANVA